MKMKRLFLLSGFIFAFGSMHAQEADQRLYKSYSQNDIEQLQSNNPESIALLNYALDHACYLSAIPEGKDFSTLPEIHLLNLTDLPSFAELGLKIEKSNQYFKVTGTQQLLVVKSEWVLNYELGKH
jgi:hypothetical protein